MHQKPTIFILSALLLILSSALAFGLEPTESVPLSLNAPLTRDFRNDERHSYTVDARANEIVEITCERKGVDIGLAAFAPDGGKIAVSNAPAGFSGFDRLIFQTEKAGRYRIEIASRRPGDIRGGYTILLRDERPADEQDRTRAAAAKALGEAREILFGAENRLEKAARALERVETARGLFEKAGDRTGVAHALFQLAFINGSEFGDKTKALGLYEKALEVWSELDDEAGKAVCLTHFADELRDYDNPAHDREYYTGRSLGYFNEALALVRKLKSASDEAIALSFLCRQYNDTNSFQKGFEACREAQRLETNDNPLTDYRIYTNLASLYSNSGDTDNALKYNRIALERLALVRDYLSPMRYAFVKSNLGSLLATRKEFKAAEDELTEALKIAESIRRTVYTGYIKVRLSSVYFETNQYQKALAYAQAGLDDYRKVDPVKRQAALNILGKSQYALGFIDEARKSFAEAVEVNRQTGDHYAEAESLFNLSNLEYKNGNLETAHQNIDQAIKNLEILRAQLLGKNQRTSFLAILKKYYELEIEMLVRLYDRTGEAGLLDAAWQKHEKMRARSLMENLLESGFNLSEIAPPGFFDKEKSLLEAIAAAEFKRAEGLKAKNAALQKDAENELHRNLDEYQLLQETVRRNNPRFSALNQPADFTIADAEKMLDGETAIIEYALVENQSYVWVIRKNTFSLVKLPSETAINQTARDFYKALTDREAKNDQTVVEKSRALSRLILQPLAGELQNLKRIIVISDESLQLVPFSALTLAPDAEYKPLAETTEIVNAPSFSSLAFMRENKTVRLKIPDKTLAIFADPIFQDDDERIALNKPKNPPAPVKVPDKLAMALRDFGLERLARLPFSGYEAREIEKFAPEQTYLALGAKASRQTFLRGDFSSYRMLHFATHGFLNQQNPELSGLVLSLYDENRRPQNGFLRMIDLYSLRLNADLVVLSACQTGLGKETDGEGIVGLTRGFMYAGAAGVVSSLWKVEDAATAELMKNFYRAMLVNKMSPAAALSWAQNELRKTARFKNPRYWSGFTLNGEGR
ncbi:MAG: CHAT domain-containing protein [Acidobacteria bacterium]|nr:CHAT domain-containing protein [Acidobacteriota bacterium]